MANRNFRGDIKSPDQGLVISAGTISIGTGSFGTFGDTVTYASASMVSTGRFRLTYEDSFVSLKASSCMLEHTGSQDLRVELSGSVFSSAGKYIDYHLLSGSALANPSTNGTKIHIINLLKNSGQ
jgi:hypothetical protein